MVSFVALDVETANYNRSSLCAIGLVKFIDGQKVDDFYTLINPQEKFYQKNINIHGITADDVKNSPTFPEIRPELIKFIDNLPVVAHNASFDFSVLNATYQKYNLKIDNLAYFCTLLTSRIVYPHCENHRLNTLAELLNIPLNHHNALSDAEACGLLLLKMMQDEKQTNLKKFLYNLGYKNYGLLGHFTFSKKGRKGKNYNTLQMANISKPASTYKTDQNITKSPKTSNSFIFRLLKWLNTPPAQTPKNKQKRKKSKKRGKKAGKFLFSVTKEVFKGLK